MSHIDDDRRAGGRYPRRVTHRTTSATIGLALTLAMLAGCTHSTPHVLPTTAPSGGQSPWDGLDIEAGKSNPVADPFYPDYGNASLDVLAYRLDLAWDDASGGLTGTATIAVRAAAAMTSIRFDFSRSYTVDSATVDGASVEPGWAGADLTLPHALDRDARATVVVRYHGQPKTVPMPSERGDFAEGLGLRRGTGGDLWTMQEPYGASTWYPANDMPSDEAVYDIRVTVPTGLSGIASGTFLGTSGPPPLWSASHAGTTYQWRSVDPVAAYLVTLAVGEYTEITDTGPDGLPLTYWLRPEDMPNEAAVRRTPELLGWLAQRFGPYPFPSGGVVFVDSESAMETQQMVTFGAANAGSPDEVAETLLHEYSHQWFGDAVTPTDWSGLWLNEGWAMYCEMLWIIDQGWGSEAEVIEWARDGDAYSRPVAGPPGRAGPDHFAESNVYFGPALMLHAIRKAVGDDEFFAMGRDWVQQHRNTQVDRAEFMAFVNQHTGRDFTALMNTWLDSPTTPTI
jgi:aminopeptidase N